MSVAGGLAQQVAEALSGVAIAQIVRPGAPCLYGSFFQATDMRTGAPALGTPESIFGVFAGAQMARRYGLPFRGGGGLLLVQRGRRAGRRPSRRSCCGRRCSPAPTWCCTRRGGSRAASPHRCEKFALDVELLEQLQVQQRGIGFSEEEFAFDALDGARPRRPVARRASTRCDHFKEWQYMSPLFTTQDFTTWTAAGGEETGRRRANRRWKQLLETYEDPGIDADVDAELHRVHGSSRRPSRPRTRTEDAQARRASTQYLSWQADEQRAALDALRDAIRPRRPDATEGISYSMAGVPVGGKGLVCYAAFKDHYSLFPMSMAR